MIQIGDPLPRIDQGNRTISVAIITTVYKDLLGLQSTADSVLEQDYPLSWVVVDADSGPETTKYLNFLTSKTHKIKWVSEKDDGLYHGMNKGFQLVKADIYLFLNANDKLATPETISSIVNSFSAERWQWAVALAVRFDEDGTPVSVWEYLNPELGGLAIGTRTFCHQATFYSRQILEKTMPYDQTNLAADHLLNIKAFKISSPKMLPFVSTYFANGGVSSKRPMTAAFKDLRRIRNDLDLYFLKNKSLDYLITKGIIVLLKMGGISWKSLKFLSRKLVKERNRIHP